MVVEVRGTLSRHKTAPAVACAVAAFIGVAACQPSSHSAADHALSQPQPSQPGSSQPLSWEPRGDLGSNDTIVDAVRQVWDADAAASISDVSLLYAGDDGGGAYAVAEPTVVVALGQASDGGYLVGWFTSTDATFTATTRLVKRAEIPAPSPDVYDIGVVVPARDSRWVALALAAPGYTVAVASTIGEDLPLGVQDPEGIFVERPTAGDETEVIVNRNGTFVTTHLIGG